MEYRHGPIVQTAFRWPAEDSEGRTSLMVKISVGGRVWYRAGTPAPGSLFRLPGSDGRGITTATAMLLMLRANLDGMARPVFAA